jgi:hypothetical protein
VAAPGEGRVGRHLYGTVYGDVAAPDEGKVSPTLYR